MPTTAAVMQTLFDWWVAPEKHDVNELFAPELDYDPGHGGPRDPELFVWLVQQKPPWRELRLLGTVIGDNNAALVFEGVDSVTLLRHRTCWLIEIRDGKIARLLETTSQLPTDAR